MIDLWNSIYHCELYHIHLHHLSMPQGRDFLPTSLIYLIDYNENWWGWGRGVEVFYSLREKIETQLISGVIGYSPFANRRRWLVPAPGSYNFLNLPHYWKLPSILFQFSLQKLNFSPLFAHVVSGFKITPKNF